MLPSPQPGLPHLTIVLGYLYRKSDKQGDVVAQPRFGILRLYFYGENMGKQAADGCWHSNMGHDRTLRT